ncbi:uncharacterized protein K444DRAFT_366364 [Hyaloscypha bicolor E]|uniref:Uncharacterized protein n=1 Tax=Hyaloscypha bicolor E TaxID=1095630 RepID=A0A2J6TDZ7_9HELO|nr:uncharacterized protein K444DRAFT_366364 [Hyaloscypha bicolor E]PMD61255.1 hypothetical protein K444DRAFT_366364 [Hyaloscypha bicolor E]
MSVLDDREFFRLAALADSSFLDIDLAPWASAAEKQLLNLRDIPAVRLRGASLDTWTWWWAHVAGVGKGAGVCTVQCLWAWMRVELGLGIRHDGARTSIRNRGGGLGGRTRDRTRRCEVRRRFGRRNERTRGNIRSQSVGQGVRRRHAWKDSGRARGPSRIGLWWQLVGAIGQRSDKIRAWKIRIASSRDLLTGENPEPMDRSTSRIWRTTAARMRSGIGVIRRSCFVPQWRTCRRTSKTPNLLLAIRVSALRGCQVCWSWRTVAIWSRFCVGIIRSGCAL